MATSILAVDEEQMNVLIKDLSENIENISDAFSEMNSLVQESKSYFNGDVADQFRNKYTEFSDNYNRIISNLQSYKTDLINSKNNYIGKDKSSSITEDDDIKLEEGGNLSGVNEIEYPKI